MAVVNICSSTKLNRGKFGDSSVSHFEIILRRQKKCQPRQKLTISQFLQEILSLQLMIIPSDHDCPKGYQSEQAFWLIEFLIRLEKPHRSFGLTSSSGPLLFHPLRVLSPSDDSCSPFGLRHPQAFLIQRVINLHFSHHQTFVRTRRLRHPQALRHPDVDTVFSSHFVWSSLLLTSESL